MARANMKTHTCEQVRIVFRSDQARDGGIVRRNIAWSNYQHPNGKTHLTELKAECVARGYHIVLTDTQVVILCNEGDLTLVC